VTKKAGSGSGSTPKCHGSGTLLLSYSTAAYSRWTVPLRRTPRLWLDYLKWAVSGTPRRPWYPWVKWTRNIGEAVRQAHLLTHWIPSSILRQIFYHLSGLHCIHVYREYHPIYLLTHHADVPSSQTDILLFGWPSLHTYNKIWETISVTPM
jgi:hypothetical protein